MAIIRRKLEVPEWKRRQMEAERVNNEVNNKKEVDTGINNADKVINEATGTATEVINPNVERQRKWRERNREINRKRARDGMRKLRLARQRRDK